MAPPLRVLITGGLGFVGAAIVTALHEAHPEWHLHVVDLHLPPSSTSDHPVHDSDAGEGADADMPTVRNAGTTQATYHAADICDAAALQAVMQAVRPAVIVHTAGLVPRGLQRYTREQEALVQAVNVGGTRNVLAAAVAAGSVRAFVLTSSSQVICDDQTHEYPHMNEDTPIPRRSLVYGESKAAAEQLVLAATGPAMATCALRPSVIFGPDDYQLVPALHACIAKGEMPWVIGSGDNLYDFTSVVNVAYAHLLAVENLLSPAATAAGQAIFISNGEPIPFRAFCLAVWAAFGEYPTWQWHIPRALAWVAGCVAEGIAWATGVPTTLCRGSVHDAVTTRYADLSKARRLLGYSPPVGLEEGIRTTCEAYQRKLHALERERR